MTAPASPSERKRHRGCRPARAFTVTELLVSIAIVAVLVALLLPGLRGVIRNRQNLQCVSNLRAMGLGFIQLATENNGRMDTIPVGSAWWFFVSNGKLTGNIPLQNRMGGVGLSVPGGNLYCPNAYENRDGMNFSRPDLHLSYGLNLLVFSRYDSSQNFLPAFLSRIPASGRLIMAAETRTNSGYLLYASMPKLWLADRHHGKFNAVFMDGHVEALDREKAAKTVGAWQSYLDPQLY